ncbi:MAG: site-specific integrase [Actinomycetota bacterium]|nr:site-specific integrase [Actinomycetota bacterium]
MRGYTAKKGNRYYAVIYEGVDPATGKERRRWHAAGSRKSEAERLVTELMKRKNDGEYRAPDRITLGVYLTDKWLPAKRAQLRPSTFDAYRRAIKRHVVPAIGRIPLQRLSPDDLDGLYSALAQVGPDGRRGLAPKTIHSIHGILHKALADASRKGSIVRNVADLADPPKLSSAKKTEMRVWDAEQLRQFLDGIHEHRLHPAYYLAANTGMRRGEVLGLRWRDVDLDARRLSVRQAVISVAYKVQISDVKTGSGRRTIDLDTRTIAVLRSWRKRQMEERLLLGVAHEDQGLVFARHEGTPIHPDLFSQTFNRLTAKSSLPVIRLHDLRHTHASLLLRSGVPVKVVSERLGHATPAFTMTVYQHVLPGMQAEAANTFADLVFGPE